MTTDTETRAPGLVIDLIARDLGPVRAASSRRARLRRLLTADVQLSAAVGGRALRGRRR